MCSFPYGRRGYPLNVSRDRSLLLRTLGAGRMLSLVDSSSLLGVPSSWRGEHDSHETQHTMKPSKAFSHALFPSESSMKKYVSQSVNNGKFTEMSLHHFIESLFVCYLNHLCKIMHHYHSLMRCHSLIPFPFGLPAIQSKQVH